MESELWEWRLCGLCTSGAGVASEQDERRLWEKMATQDRNGKLVVIWQAYATRGEAYRKNGEGGNSLRLNIRWWRKKKHTTEWMTERKQPEAWNWITIQIHQNPSMPNPRQSGTRIKKARKIRGEGKRDGETYWNLTRDLALMLTFTPVKEQWKVRSASHLNFFWFVVARGRKTEKYLFSPLWQPHVAESSGRD